MIQEDQECNDESVKDLSVAPGTSAIDAHEPSLALFYFHLGRDFR